jgi:hypothetical protein
MIMIVVVYAGAVVFCLLVSMHLAMGEGIHVPGQKTQMPPGMQPRRSRVEWSEWKESLMPMGLRGVVPMSMAEAAWYGRE